MFDCSLSPPPNNFPIKAKGANKIHQNFFKSNRIPPAAAAPPLPFRAFTPKDVATNAPIPAAAILSPDL